MSDTDWAEAAAEARRSMGSFPLPRTEGLAAAYDLQDAYVSAVDLPVGGYKLAVNGAALMARFGVEEPVSARVFAPEMYHSGVALPRAGFHAVTVEPELAAVLGDIPDGPVDRAAAQAAILRFHPAFELIDLRGLAMADLALEQAVALNVTNAGLVLGQGSVTPEELDLRGLHVTLAIDDTEVAAATGAAPQDPVDAVMWLLNHLAARGLRPEPGHIVLCGTHLPIRTLEPGSSTARIEMSGLGDVSFTLTD